jgi:hypothetical protein
VTLRLVVRAMEIIDSIGLEVVNVRARVPVMPSRVTVNISSRPSRSDAAAPGVLAGQRGREGFRVAEPGGRVRVGEDPAQLGVDPATLGLGQMVGDVSSLVDSAALDRGLSTEYVCRRLDHPGEVSRLPVFFLEVSAVRV